MSSDKILNKILWKGKSKWELILGSIGFFLGIFLFLFCLQLYYNIEDIFSKRLSLEKQLDYIILNKKVSTKNIKSKRNTGFTNEEINQIRSLDFVEGIGVLISNNFAARATFNLFGQGFVTEIFFEAVPDDFLDFIPDSWAWGKASDFIPIIISRDFLLLYNFGFSKGRGLPPVSEKMIESVPITLELFGKDQYKKYRAHITGLSDRIASILVPYSFLTWANNTFGNIDDKKPSRILISVKDRSNPAIIKFIQEKGYEASREKLRLSDAGFTIKIVLGIVGLISVLLIVLSFTIFFINFRLIISNLKTEIKLLIDLGYTKMYIVKQFMKKLSFIFIFLSVIISLVFLISLTSLHNFLLKNGFTLSLAPNPILIFTGIFLVIMVFAGNFLSISKNIPEK